MKIYFAPELKVWEVRPGRVVCSSPLNPASSEAEGVSYDQDEYGW